MPHTQQLQSRLGPSLVCKIDTHHAGMSRVTLVIPNNEEVLDVADTLV